MAFVLGVHVGVDEISAALVQADLPELGPVAARTVSVSSVPGGIGDAIATLLGIMRVQAAQNDLQITGSAVVCDNFLQCEIVRTALINHNFHDVEVLDVGDPRLNADYSLDIAAALIGTAARTGTPAAGSSAAAEEKRSSPETDKTGTPRSSRVMMIGLGVAVLAALSGATVWALEAADPTQNPVVDTADVAEMPSSEDGATGSSVAVVADSAGPPLGPSTVPPADTATGEAPLYGPVPVGTWSEAPPTGPVPGPYSEASSGGGGSGGGNPVGARNGVVAGGGGSGSDDSDVGGNSGGGASGGGNSGGGNSGGGVTPTVDPTPEPGPEPEVPPTSTPEPTTEVPATTEPTTDPEPSEDPVG